jgi:hypothetical protein
MKAGRSCTDHINTLRVIAEQMNKFLQSFYLVFVDFQKAFDTLAGNGEKWHTEQTAELG